MPNGPAGPQLCHIVLGRLRDDRRATFDIDQLRQLLADCHGYISLRVAADLRLVDNGYDFGIFIVLAQPQDLHTYLAQDGHKAVQAYLHPLLASTAKIDVPMFTTAGLT